MPVTLDLFNNETDFKVYPAGSTVFQKGDPGDAMYVILDGHVELRIGERIIEILGAGEIFGEMALIDGAPRIATTVAKTECKLVPIAQKRFLFLVQQTPFFSLQIMRVIAERLRRMDDKA